MALISEYSQCLVCGSGVLGRPFIVTPWVVELFGLSDTPIHIECLEAWPEREAFCERNFPSDIPLPRVVLRRFGAWILYSGPSGRDELPDTVVVAFRHWPFQLTSRWADWDAFVGGGYRGELSGAPLAHAAHAMRRIQMVAPDLEALDSLFRRRRDVLVSSGAWDAAESAAAEAEQERAARIRELLPHRALVGLLLRRLRLDAVTCPHCGQRSRDFAFVDGGSTTRSRFVCNPCGRSFGPEQVPGDD